MAKVRGQQSEGVVPQKAAASQGLRHVFARAAKYCVPATMKIRSIRPIALATCDVGKKEKSQFTLLGLPGISRNV